jgi:hypothetical protein
MTLFIILLACLILNAASGFRTSSKPFGLATRLSSPVTSLKNSLIDTFLVLRFQIHIIKYIFLKLL